MHCLAHRKCSLGFIYLPPFFFLSPSPGLLFPEGSEPCTGPWLQAACSNHFGNDQISYMMLNVMILPEIHLE